MVGTRYTLCMSSEINFDCYLGAVLVSGDGAVVFPSEVGETEYAGSIRKFTECFAEATHATPPSS